MNKEKQRIKIAEACGWRLFSSFKNLWAPPRHVVEYDCDAYPLPDYLNDLNAMHEAEKACLTTIPLVTDYGIRLVNALHREHKKNPRIQDTSWRIPVVGNCGWFATAAQRAEAFLKTSNLWEE